MSKEDLNQREFFPHPSAIEPVSEYQLSTLARILGLGVIAVDFHKVDPTVGRGVLHGQDRCLWTTEGKRITVQTGGGTTITSLSSSPDPLYASLKAGKGL